MMFLFLLLVLLATAALVWLGGLWSAVITWVNLLLAMLIATNYFEPVATLLENSGAASWTYLLDFVVLWLLFFLAFGVLRTLTDALSRNAIEFDKPLELAGKAIFALWCGWLMVCFTAFSLHMAPLNSADPLGAWSTPQSRAFGPLAPDRLWLGLVYSRSRGALAGPNPFDPQAEFLIKYHHRRAKYSEPEMAMRVAR